MSFEDFAKMAKEEFGLTVVKAPEYKQSSFESLFRVSTKCIEQYELPFSVSVEQLDYYYENTKIYHELVDDNKEKEL